MYHNDLMIFTGNTNPLLAESVAQYLGISLGRATVGRFSDDEIMVELLDSVRGRDVFILQSICGKVNDALMEIMIMADALRRASAGKITAAIPYFGYARQDRRPRSARVPITAKVVANMLTSVGVNRVLTMDLHSDQIQGFFDIPVDNIYASPVLIDDLIAQQYSASTIVSPDVGGVVRARAFAKQLDVDLVIIDKRRPDKNVAKVMNIIGDVANRTCIIVDDMVDTANTMCEAATALKKKGALKVVAYCTHPVLSNNAVERIAYSELDEVVITNTIPFVEANKQKSTKLRQLDISALLGETIARISRGSSVSPLFEGIIDLGGTE